MPVRVLLFDADGNDTELPPTQPLHIPGERQLLWVDIEGEAPPAFLVLLAGLGLGPGTCAALAAPEKQRPRLAHHGDYVTLNMNAARTAEDFLPLVVATGLNFVVTSHPQKINALTEFGEQMKGDTQLGKLDSAAFLAVLLTRLLETYFEAVGEIEQATDDLDAELLRANNDKEPLEDLVDLRRAVGVLRRELAAHRPLFMHLSSPDFVVYAGDEHETQFNALLMQFDHALDNVAHTRELVLGSFDLYMTSLGQRTNDTMRVLTVFTIILGVLAAVAGFMGMNFEADIFKAGNDGFRDVLLFSAGVILLLLGLGRWRKWL